MKVNVKKKKIVVISIAIFLFVTLLVFLIAYFYRLYRAPIDVGDYQDILEVCEVNRDKQLRITCTAFLNYYEDKGELESDFYLSIVTPEDDFKNFEYTLEKGKYSNENLDLAGYDFEKTIPIYVEFIFEKKFLGSYSLKKVINRRIPDDELYSITLNLYDKNRVIPDIQSEEEKSLESKGYYLSNPLKLTEERGFERAYFFNGEIEEVAVDDNEIEMDIKFEIESIPYKTSFKTEALLINNNLYSSENIESYEFEGPYQIGFFYLLEESNLTTDNLENYCSQNDLASNPFALCKNIEDRDLTAIELANFEGYLEDSLENAENGFVNINKLILTYIENK